MDDEMRFCPKCGAERLRQREISKDYMFECFCEACEFVFVLLANDYVALPES
jgi:predicted  nucleic acid-binding Zn ribbon protein